MLTSFLCGVLRHQNLSQGPHAYIRAEVLMIPARAASINVRLDRAFLLAESTLFGIKQEYIKVSHKVNNSAICHGDYIYTLCMACIVHVHVTGHVNIHIELKLDKYNNIILVQSCEVGDFVSDHNSILVSLNSSKPHPEKKYTTFRKIKSVVPESFSSDISSSDLTKQLPSNVDEMVSCYNRVLKELMDKHAPLKSRALLIVRPNPG